MEDKAKQLEADQCTVMAAWDSSDSENRRIVEQEMKGLWPDQLSGQKSKKKRLEGRYLNKLVFNKKKYAKYDRKKPISKPAPQDKYWVNPVKFEHTPEYKHYKLVVDDHIPSCVPGSGNLGFSDKSSE